MTFENELAQVAQQYRAEGYDVTVRPQDGLVPPFAAGFQLDLLATKGTEKVLVQVKESPEELKKDPDTSRMAEVINAQPGWRFDLIVLHGSLDWVTISKEACEPTIEQILQSLADIERTAKASSVALSLVLAWGALEAAMRRAARAEGLQMKVQAAEALLPLLYSNGLLEREEYDKLLAHLGVRNAVVRGLHVPALDATSPAYAAGVARKLLAWGGNELPGSASGDPEAEAS